MATTISSTSLPTLPKEMLGNIVELLPQSSLLDVCLACRSLYKAAVVKLYNHVYFSDRMTFGIPGLDVDRSDAVEDIILKRAQSSSRIKNLSLFLRTIMVSPSLRSLVCHATFDLTKNDCESTSQGVRTMLSLIGRQLQTLHYSTGYWDFGAPQLPLTSIQTKYPGWKRSGNEYGMSHAYALFMTPTLRHVSFQLDNVAEEFFQPGDSFAVSNSSNVESLSLNNLGRISNDLGEMMTWPKTLKSFYCELRIGLDGLPSATVPQLSRLLSFRQKSLEQVIISHVSGWNADFHSTFGKEFREFPMLKRLELPREYLSAGGTYCDSEQIADSLDLVLPPNLEELQLDISKDATSITFESNLPFLEDSSSEDLKITKMMQHIAIRKQALYPSLRRVVLWCDCRPTTSPEDLLEHEVALRDKIGVLQDMEAAGVDYSIRAIQRVPEVWDIQEVNSL